MCSTVPGIVCPEWEFVMRLRCPVPDGEGNRPENFGIFSFLSNRHPINSLTIKVNPKYI